jgi:hypothetical protein
MDRFAATVAEADGGQFIYVIHNLDDQESFSV